ncbi:hydroxypyruvate isomerase family protein [Algisphaera agarilytica]|uniref:Hydroxypyruvate isomerase n=1 Tax=Algisphaera agarilytica TaxID=1385975 RepID=A0A7X0H5M4_9BACT|nr:TIM barrel protein [Algisphaera agarilytica]MBB6429502.1 hydroxypyruvate isomerase [Algisphaera agarilytica]
MIDRRGFLAAGLASTAGLAVSATGEVPSSVDALPTEPFNLLYAPHFGMFKHHAGDDLIDQLKFAHSLGFRAWEDNGMMKRDVATQEKIAATMSELGMTMGVFVAHAGFKDGLYVNGGSEARAFLQQQMREAVEVAKRVNAKWCTIVPGKFVNNLEWDYQTANVVDCLRAMAEVCEPEGLVMVLEPLNPWTNHPGLFLTKIPQAYAICEAVNSPSCKILDDLYHQQITEGNLIPNMEKAWKHIAYIQVGDNPGRKEPGTGEINYLNVFADLHRRGFKGIVGMEHGNSVDGKEGELRVINAYRQCDAFLG